MLMHLAVPDEFDSLIEFDGIFDELPEAEIRRLWSESYQRIDDRTVNFQFLTSLKQFFGDKGLDFSPLLKSIFQVFQTKDKTVSVDAD